MPNSSAHGSQDDKRGCEGAYLRAHISAADPPRPHRVSRFALSTCPRHTARPCEKVQNVKAESFEAWCRIGAALSIGKAEALRTTGANQAAGQFHCQAFHRWIVDHGFRHNATLRPQPRCRITRKPSRDHRMA